MIRRLAIPAALALALGACATYDSGYSNRSGYYSSDGYYRGSGYDDGNYDAYSGDGYYSPGSDGYGDYYYDRPQVIYNDSYSSYYGGPYYGNGYGYGSYGFGYGLSYFPHNGFGIGFGSGYYGGYPYGYSPWYPGYYYNGHHRHHDNDRDDRSAGPPRNGDARREAERLIDQGGLPGGSAHSVVNSRAVRSGIPVNGSGDYGSGLPRDRADYGGTSTPPISDMRERRRPFDGTRPDRQRVDSDSGNSWRQGWRRSPAPRDQGDRQQVTIAGDGTTRGEGMRLSPGMAVPSQMQPMPRPIYRQVQPSRQQVERVELRQTERREERESPSREDSPRRSREADGRGRDR